MCRDNINFFLWLSLHVLKVSSIRVKNYLCWVVKKYTRAPVGEKIAKPIFWWVVNPFFDIDFLAACWGFCCVVKVILLVAHLREVILGLDLTLRCLVWFHSSCLTHLCIPGMEILLAVKFIILLVFWHMEIWLNHLLSLIWFLSFNWLRLP